jgi:hypothetical protein
LFSHVVKFLAAVFFFAVALVSSHDL